MPPSHSVAHTYAEEISSLDNGLGIWDPDPGFDGLKKRKPRVRPGDVGYVTEQGTFRRLFNLHLPIDHEEQAARHKLPVHFTNFDLDLTSDVEGRTYEPESVRSRTRRGIKGGAGISGPIPVSGGVSFAFSRDRGALLRFFEPGWREDSRVRKAYERCFILNRHEWLEIAQIEEPNLRMENIILVTGCSRARSWATAVIDDKSVKGDLKLSVDIASVAGLHLSCGIFWDNTLGTRQNHGPHERLVTRLSKVKPDEKGKRGKNRGGNAKEQQQQQPTASQIEEWSDQCLFIRGYRVKDGFFGVKLKAAAQPQDLPRNDDHSPDGSAQPAAGAESGDDGSLERIPPYQSAYDHMDAALDYILLTSGAPVALVHEDDLLSYKTASQHGRTDNLDGTGFTAFEVLQDRPAVKIVKDDNSQTQYAVIDSADAEKDKLAPLTLDCPEATAQEFIAQFESIISEASAKERKTISVRVHNSVQRTLTIYCAAYFGAFLNDLDDEAKMLLSLPTGVRPARMQISETADPETASMGSQQTESVSSTASRRRYRTLGSFLARPSRVVESIIGRRDPPVEGNTTIPQPQPQTQQKAEDGVDAENDDDADAHAIPKAVTEAFLNLRRHLEHYSLHYQADALALRSAITEGDNGIVHLLLNLGVDIEYRYEQGETALQLAALNGRQDIVRILIKHGAHVKANALVLFDAAKNGSVDIMQLLMDQGLDSNIRSVNSKTIFQLATERGHTELVRFLLKLHIHTLDLDGPLLVAAEKGHFETLQLLVSSGASMSSRDENSKSSLGLASENGHTQIVRLLLDHGAGEIVRPADVPVSEERYGRTRRSPDSTKPQYHCPHDELSIALNVAAANDHADVVGLLIDHGVVPAALSSALWAAANHGHHEIVADLLERGAGVDARDGYDQSDRRYQINGHSALAVAARKGYVSIVRLLLERDAKAVEDQTALRNAITTGKLEVVQLLIFHGADLHAQYRDDLLDSVINSGHYDMACFLIDNGIRSKGDSFLSVVRGGHTRLAYLLLLHGNDKVDHVGPNPSLTSTALHIAAECGHTDTARLLLDHNADIEARDYRKRSPLQLACEKGHLTTVRLLLEFGAQAKDDPAALRNAAREGHLEIVQLLLKQCVDVDAADFIKRTALSLATEAGHVGVTRLLLLHGARPDKDKCIFPNAAYNGHFEIVRLLLEYGVNIGIRDDRGRTAMGLAIDYGRGSIVRLLLEHGEHFYASEMYLDRAAEKGHLEIVQICVERGVPVTTSRNALFRAVIGGHLGVVRYLVLNGADLNAVDETSRTLLDSAEYYWRTRKRENEKAALVDIARFLVEKGADVNACANHGRDILKMASRTGDTELVRLLIEHGLKIESASQTLSAAVDSGNIELVHVLLDKGVQTEPSESNPLEQAAGNFELLRTLVKRKQTTWAVGPALWRASTNGRFDIVLWLLYMGVHTDDISHAFVDAAENNRVEIMTLLIEHGVRQNTISAALEHAVGKGTGNMKAIEFLLEHGVDVTTNADALMAAIVKGDTEVMRLLLKYGASVEAIDTKALALRLNEARSGRFSSTRADDIVNVLHDTTTKAPESKIQEIRSLLQNARSRLR